MIDVYWRVYSKIVWVRYTRVGKGVMNWCTYSL